MFENSENLTDAERLDRIEKFLTKLLDLAATHPMGKMFLKMIGA